VEILIAFCNTEDSGYQNQAGMNVFIKIIMQEKHCFKMLKQNLIERLEP
jgi:hypothetical protein